MTTEPDGLVKRLRERAEAYERMGLMEDNEYPEADEFCDASGGDGSRHVAKLMREAADALSAAQRMRFALQVIAAGETTDSAKMAEAALLSEKEPDSTQVGTQMIVPVPAKKIYRLRDGSRGTEYEAMCETIRYWQTKRQEAEDKLEELQRRLPLAEGHP